MIDLTSEAIADLGMKAERAASEFDTWTSRAPDWNNGRLHPEIVVALLDRIAALEAERHPPPKALADACEWVRACVQSACDDSRDPTHLMRMADAVCLAACKSEQLGYRVRELEAELAKRPHTDPP